jgi:hypothetical protein
LNLIERLWKFVKKHLLKVLRRLYGLHTRY